MWRCRYEIIEERIDERYQPTNVFWKPFSRQKMFAKIIKELCEYKTIEEELSIDLITLLKVWNAVLQKEYLWAKYDNELDETNDIEIGDEMNGLLYIYFYWSDGKHLVLYLKDYGKTWALTKEELEC